MKKQIPYLILVLAFSLSVGCGGHNLTIEEMDKRDGVSREQRAIWNFQDSLNKHPPKTFHFKGSDQHFPINDTMNMNVWVYENLIYDQPMKYYYFGGFREDSLLIFIDQENIKWVKGWFPTDPTPSPDQWYFPAVPDFELNGDSIFPYSKQQVIQVK